MAFTAQGAEEFLKHFLLSVQTGLDRPRLQALLLDWLGQVPPRHILKNYIQFRALLDKAGKASLGLQLEEAEPQLANLVETALQTYSDSDLKELQVHHFLVDNEFAALKKGTDDDIAAYFHSRNLKDMEGAKRVYLRLSQRYPEADSRVTLLRFWRTKNPLFLPLFVELKHELGARLAENIRKSILHILRCFTEDSRQTALSLFARIKHAVQILPADRTKAVHQLRKLQLYAEKLAFHSPEFDTVCDILEDYFGESLVQRKEIKLVLPESVEDNRGQTVATHVQTFDFANVKFSTDDLKVITVNPAIKGIENQVLAYCYQYWPLAQDSEFENKVYLYSVRFKGPQLTILQIIKKGQQLGSKDEDILYSLYHLLAKSGSYQYNVRKDIYMQSVWRRIKPGEEAAVIEDSRSFAEEQIRIMRDEKTKRLLKASETAKQEKAQKQRHRLAAEQQVKQTREQKGLARLAAQQKVAQSKAIREQRKARIQSLQTLGQTAHPFTPVVEKNLQAEWTSYDSSQTKVESIAVRLNRMDHTEQKNLSLIFRRRIEAEIQTFLDQHLQALGQTVKTVNRTLAVLAIKEFIFNNFDREQRNWAVSNERLKVKELGITITDVEPIIENCLTSLGRELAAAI